MCQPRTHIPQLLPGGSIVSGFVSLDFPAVFIKVLAGYSLKVRSNREANIGFGHLRRRDALAALDLVRSPFPTGDVLVASFIDLDVGHANTVDGEARVVQAFRKIEGEHDLRRASNDSRRVAC